MSPTEMLAQGRELEARFEALIKMGDDGGGAGVGVGSGGHERRGSGLEFGSEAREFAGSGMMI